MTKAMVSVLALVTLTACESTMTSGSADPMVDEVLSGPTVSAIPPSVVPPN